MSILVINSGSTSIKYKLFKESEKAHRSGSFKEIKNYELAIKQLLRDLNDWRDLTAVGHRVVHGGNKFIDPVLIDEKIIASLEEYNNLAPLHNPYNLAGIKACFNFFPQIPQVAVFDTAFFFSLPPVAKTYALPQPIRLKNNFQRYGFHGISHSYLVQEAASQLKKNIDQVNLITCHLGGGWSVAAIKNGRAIDTSMGWTPLEGLIMMTRAGDLDPAIVIELVRQSGSGDTEEDCQRTEAMLNCQSGIVGLAQVADYQELLREMAQNSESAKLAFDAAIYRLVKYIGAYWAVLDGQVDAIVFSGAIGAGNPITRNQVMAKLKYLGSLPALVIKTDEELMIMRQTKQLLD